MTSTNESGTLRTTSSSLESEEMSVENTVPTDLTLSPESDGGRQEGRRRGTAPTGGNQTITRQQLERKQLLHDLQLLKIELSQKTLLLDNLKADTMARTEELEERLAETRHAKQILQARLESQLTIQKEEARRRQEATQLELNLLLRRQSELEETNAKLQDRATDLRRTLYNLEIDEQQYKQLRLEDPAQMSLRDFVAVKIYELIHPHQSEADSLRAKVQQIANDHKMLINKSERVNQEWEAEKMRADDFETRHQRSLSELKRVQSQIQLGDYKIENFDKVKSERDKLLEESMETQKTMSTTKALHSAAMKELDDLKTERGTTQQKVSLLQQDKEFLSKRLLEVSNQCQNLNDQLSKSNMQLEKVLQAREEIYEKYVGSRDIYKFEFERKLKDEMEELQKKAQSEIDQLKNTARTLHEQELRSLTNAANAAVLQKDKAEASEKLATEKYEKLLEQLRIKQSDVNTQSSNLKSQLMLKTFELEQLRALHADTHRSLQEFQLENEKLKTKIELVTTEVHETDRKLLGQLTDAKTQLAEKAAKLSMYEKIEEDLDDVIMQAAQGFPSLGDSDGDQVLRAFGDGAGLPAAVKRRMQHSFQLAKRIFLLEKQSAQLRSQLHREKKSAEDHSEEIIRLKETLENTNKPEAHLIDVIQRKDEEIKGQTLKIKKLEEQIVLFSSSRAQMEKQITRLTTDMEKLLNNREEISKMKRLLVDLFPNHFKDLPVNNTRTEPIRRVPMPDVASRSPKATIFTKPKMPNKQSWK